MSDPIGMTSRRSRHGADETAHRLLAALVAAGQTIFADVDHALNAAEVGLTLRPTRMILFGNPAAGTALMEAAQTIGLDLPLKALIWQDAEGATWLSYNQPVWLAERHGLGEAAQAAVQAIAAGMDKLAESAAA